MKFIQPTLLATALTASFASSVVHAHESCNVDLSAGFTINPTTIEFLQEENGQENRSLYKITDGKVLSVGGSEVSLSGSQQQLVEKYDAKIRQLVPEVKNVAIEGVDLAVDGVNLAFNGLLGEGNSVAADLTKELKLVREQVATNLTIENGITIGVDGLESNELLGEDFEQRIESAVEKAVLNSMGTILIAVGQQMMTADGDEQSFETRMEEFGENLEQEMNARADKIEAKAEKLCVSIAKLDVLEEQLKAEIEPLNNTNVFTVTQNEHEDDKDLSAK